MKKILLGIIAASLISCGSSKPDRVLCDSLSQPIFDRFLEVAQENKLEIDFSQVHSVSFAPLNWGMQGVYNVRTKTIILNLDYHLPKVIADDLTPGQHRKMVQDGILYILAHEIGHSQGFHHLEAGTPELMAENDQMMYWLIVEEGVEDIICKAFDK